MPRLCLCLFATALLGVAVVPAGSFAAPAMPTASAAAGASAAPAASAVPSAANSAAVPSAATSDVAPSPATSESNAGESALPPASASADAGARLVLELDITLREAAEDLGLSLSYQHPASGGPVDEALLLERAQGGYALGSELVPTEGGYLLRLSLVRPGRSVIEVGRAEVTEQTLEVSAIRLLQELADGGEPERPPEPVAAPRVVLPPHRSAGKAVLTAHGALVGGYLGFSLEHIAGVGDARLVFPLMTLGAGAGVGASLVIAEEWDISPAEAWYVWAAGTWSTISGRLIASSTEGASNSRRYGYGLLGTALGLTLGSVALNTGDVAPGGALLTHSGALFGAHFGAIGQLMVRGDATVSPTLGLGIGMGAGLVVAGAMAPHVDSLSASRVLFVDVSAILGGLAGAALASPILVGEELSPSENRIWLGSVALGTVAGAVVGTLVTTDETDSQVFSWRPYFDVLPDLAAARAPAVPVVGVAGTW